MVSVSVDKEEKTTIQQMLHKYAKRVIGFSMLSFGLVIILFIINWTVSTGRCTVA